MNPSVFSGSYFRVVEIESGLLELCLDRRGDKLNMLDAPMTAELGLALDAIGRTTGVRGLLVSSSKDGFLAGAEIQALQALFDETAASVTRFSLDMNRALSRLSDLPVPVVTAINGFALGGGLEFALCSDYRVLAADGRIGFPEVSLGILPGAGGTVRLPRLIGAAAALEWIVGSRTCAAEAARESGVVDAVSEPTALKASAIEWLEKALSGELDWRGRRSLQRGSFALDEARIAPIRQQAQRSARHYPAASVVVALIERCASLSRDDSFPQEAAGLAQLIGTPTARALVGILSANQQIRKKSRSQAADGVTVTRAAVLGAGIMGGGVAYTTAVKGIPVLMKDIAQPALDLGLAEARKLLAKQVEIGKLKAAKAEAVLASIVPTLDFDQFDSVDIVVEAVVENLAVKQAVLAEVEALARPGTVLASNTSSLSIADIAAKLQRPEDVVGMHFFNPVHLMPLVEIVRGPKTRDAAIAKTVGYALAMGKTPLVVKDCEGFLINRILGAYFTAFLQLLRDGVDFERIDSVMEAWGWPMGPAYLIDVAGIDTLDKALAILGKAYPKVMATDFRTAIQVLAEQKRYGQKSGAGFYQYQADTKGKPKRSADPRVRELLKPFQNTNTFEISDRQIVERMMYAMILEAGRCLDEQVAEDAVDIDAGMRLGTGFPAHHGGPLWFADAIGLSSLIEQLRAYAGLGGLFAPGAGLVALAGSGGRFHGTDVRTARAAPKAECAA